uniref:SGS domain-containing protein n=1 Tax=Chelydra serpentina TaxID=8475 RepID=A0A8C3S9G1_CHESE
MGLGWTRPVQSSNPSPVSVTEMSEWLEKDLEEVKELLKKATRKRTHDVLMAEKCKLEMEIKNQPPPKLKEDTTEEEKPPAGGYTVKINSYGRIALPPPTSCRSLVAPKSLEGPQSLAFFMHIHLSYRKASYDTSDPGEGLMNLLKKMYSEGDDEMKRTINKAWVESREKQGKGDMPLDI